MRLWCDLKPYCRPFRQPLQTAHGLWTDRQGLLVRLTDREGRISYGEIAPIPWFGRESLEMAEGFCDQHQGWWDQGLPAIPEVLPACQFGLESAWGDLQISEGDNFAAREPAPERICGLLPAGEQALTTWPELWAKGHRTLKWKVGVASIPEELDWLETLVEVLPDQAQLRLDANGGLDWAGAERWLEACDRINATSAFNDPRIAFLEQPLPPDAFPHLLELSQRFSTPIALDESVATLGQLEACHRQGWQGVSVVKPGIAGSPSRLRQFCQQHRPSIVFSSGFETVVGRQAALRLIHQIYPSRRGDPAHQAPAPCPALGFGTLDWFDDNWDTLTPDQLWQNL